VSYLKVLCSQSSGGNQEYHEIVDVPLENGTRRSLNTHQKPEPHRLKLLVYRGIFEPERTEVAGGADEAKNDKSLGKYNIHREIAMGKPQIRVYLEVLGIERRIMLKWSLQIKYMTMKIGCNEITVGSVEGVGEYYHKFCLVYVENFLFR
jgi:hypothetical protein